MFHSRFKRRTLAVVLSTIFANSAIAAETQSAEDDIEQINIWSTEVNASSLYLQGEEIANKQADHISDLLRTIPGVDVGGAHSLNQRITIRSMDDKDLMISIDGAMQNSYMFHHMGNLQIHADILKSVDIEIGSNSVINGGLGGAVHFETKAARELLDENAQFGARIQLGYADNANRSYSITGYGLLTDNIDFLAYFNQVSRDNYRVGGGKILNSEGEVVAGTDGEVRGLEGDLHDGLLKLGWDIDAQQRLSLSVEKYQDKGDYSQRPDMGLATDVAIANSLNIPLLWPTEFTRDTYTLNHELQWGENSQLRTALYSNVSELWRDQTGYAQNPAFADSAEYITGEAKNTGLTSLGTTTIDGALLANDVHDLTYGVNYIQHDTHYNAQPLTGASTSSGEESTLFAVFLQDRWQINEQFTLIPGVRYNHYELATAVANNTYSDTTFALAAEWRPIEQLLFKLSGTELFKGPEIGEVFVGAGLYDTPNPDIEAETGNNAELAVAYQSTLDNGHKWSVGATAFRTQLDNYIYDSASVPGGGPRDSWKDNVGDMKITGIETYIGYSADALRMQLTFSNSDSELNAFSDYLDLNGARLDRQQGDTISANINYALEAYNLQLNWETQHVGRVEQGNNLDGASLSNAKNAFSVHNISANWQPQSVEGLTVVFGVDNLFDEFYASQSSRTGVSVHPRFGRLYLLDYEPGRNVKATISYRF